MFISGAPPSSEERTVNIFSLSPVLIRKFFENHQSDPVLIPHVKPCVFRQFHLPHGTQALLELLCL